MKINYEINQRRCRFLRENAPYVYVICKASTTTKYRETAVKVEHKIFDGDEALKFEVLLKVLMSNT